MSDETQQQQPPLDKFCTFTLVNPETGQFGAIVSGSMQDIGPMLTSSYVEGAFDASTHKLDVATGQVVSLPPRGPLLHELRQQRNEMLETWRWTVMPDSPLTGLNMTEWLDWLRSLHSALKDLTEDQTAGFTWPAKPAIIYADGNEE